MKNILELFEGEVTSDLLESFKDLKIGLVYVTPEYAQKLLESNDSNRRKKDRVVRYYSKLMEDNKWEFIGDTIKICKDGSLLDKQHTLLSCVKSNKPFYGLVITGFDKSIFPLIDGGVKRTTGDVFYIAKVPNSTNMAAAMRKYITLDKNLLLKNSINSRTLFGVGSDELLLTNKDLLDLYHEKETLYNEIWSISDSLYKTKLLLGTEYFGYIAYLHLSKKHKLEKVVSFFSQLSSGKNYENPTIELLRDRLWQNIVSPHKLNGKYKQVMIIKTWNCYITGNTLKQLKYNSETDTIPEFI